MDATPARSEAATEPTLSVIVVNFRSWPDVARLITSLTACAPARARRCEVIVVDNASGTAPPAAIGQAGPTVRLIERADNGGFAAGVNTGWRSAQGRWLLLLNPDVVAAPRFLDDVLARVDAFERDASSAPGIVGFGLRNPDGTRQPSVGAEPGIWRALMEPFLPRSRRKYKAVCRTRAGRVPWVTGACALVDANVMSALGGMDEDFFLYYEEVALCCRIRALGRSVEFDPTVEVVHLRPLQNRPVTPGLRVITRHSKLVFFQKYRGRVPFQIMARLTEAEALVRSVWGRLQGCESEWSAWQCVRKVARALRRGRRIEAAQVRDLALALGMPQSGLDTTASRTTRARRASTPTGVD